VTTTATDEQLNTALATLRIIEEFRLATEQVARVEGLEREVRTLFLARRI
jgi:hypothetical protein